MLSYKLIFHMVLKVLVVVSRYVKLKTNKKTQKNKQKQHVKTGKIM